MLDTITKSLKAPFTDEPSDVTTKEVAFVWAGFGFLASMLLARS